ncbi:hypothetical protein [Neobacillus sp. LXY-1]|uniref:hypothetical protein n=1 Tax=Neobacillus sp. LXY-1 TaxID=3379133 RepID=UPI003EE0FE26
MSNRVNIIHFNVQRIANNANINFGAADQNSHTSNNTIIGGNFSFGDGGDNSFTNINNGNIDISNENKEQDS